MEDTLFKQSLRWFVRVLYYGLKLMLAPIHLVLVVLMFAVNGLEILIPWAKNDEKEYEYAVKMLNNRIKGLKLWYTI